MTAFGFAFDLPERDVKVVVDDNCIGRRQLVEAERICHRPSGEIHERQRLKKQQPVPFEFAFPVESAKAFSGDLNPGQAGKAIQNNETRIVAGP
jgi:hypothetical protein